MAIGKALQARKVNTGVAAGHAAAPARTQIAEEGHFAASSGKVARELIVPLAWVLSAAQADWGRYYETQPRLMCGNIREGLAFLGGQACVLAPAGDACAAGASA